MAQFQVPQFIEIEDKIVGPLTLRQFLYLAAAGILSFLLFFVLQTWLWFIVAALFGSTAAIFAFAKYNGRPISTLVKSAFSYLWQPKFYLWQRTEAAPQRPLLEAQPIAKSPLQNLWLRLTTSTQALTKREKTFRPPERLEKKFELFRKLTGEREAARRIDYR